MLCFSTQSNLKLRKFFGKIRTVFEEINLQHHRFWLSCWIIEGVCAKNLKATLLFVDFSKEFDSIHWGKMEQILHWGVGEGATSFPGLLRFALDPYLIVLSVKQGRIKYHFLSLWYDLTWDWSPVSWTIGEHSTH